MSRATELARLAVKRWSMTGHPLEECIADVIRSALNESAQADPIFNLPRAMAAAVTIMRRVGKVSPELMIRFTGTTSNNTRRLMLRLHAAGVVVRLRRGLYELHRDWRRNAFRESARIFEAQDVGRRTGRNRAKT